MKNKLFGFITFLISISICWFGGEIMIRLIQDAPSPIKQDERNLLYQHDQELGWFPIPNSMTDFMGSRLIQVNNNSLGFRDMEYGEKTKKRIAFIGDSFLWGYDVNAEERFTEKLRPLLSDFEILNLGVSGYSTDQEFLLLKRWFDKLQPDIVILLFFHVNDFPDNTTNELFGYYKPYFILGENNDLTLNGIPVPVSRKYFQKEYPILHKSRLFEFFYQSFHSKKVVKPNPTFAIFKEMKDFVKSKEAEFYLAFVGEADQKDYCQICENETIKNVFVNNTFQYKTHGNHWTPEGHDYVAKKLYDFIINLD